MESTNSQINKQELANCRIWAHWLFWTICPFGVFISTFKTRVATPLLVAVLIGFSTGVASAFIDNEDDAESFITVGVLVAQLTGGAMTHKLIRDARNQSGIEI